MLLSEIFYQLTYGELTQLSLGGVHTSGILEQDYPKVIPHINLGLTELHKRFDIKKNELFLQQFESINIYYLESRYAKSNEPETAPPENLGPVDQYYILDTAENPFQDDVIRIERIFDNEGVELYMNQLDADLNENIKYDTVHTPTFNSIRVPYPVDDEQLRVTYRASHPLIPLTGVDPNNYQISLPVGLLESLLLYIAARYSLARGTELSLSEGQLYMQKFEASVLKITELNLNNTNDSFNSRFDRNGWV